MREEGGESEGKKERVREGGRTEGGREGGESEGRRSEGGEREGGRRKQFEGEGRRGREGMMSPHQDCILMKATACCLIILHSKEFLHVAYN